MAYVDLIYKLANTDIEVDIMGEIDYLSQEYLIAQDEDEEYRAYILDENDELYPLDDEELEQNVISMWKEDTHGLKDISWNGEECSDRICNDYLAAEDNLNFISDNFDEESY